ncbi:2-dehydropantoate 2-reductase [Aspergillus campestris IBT 28561]|uniref:2-dehydropantoate 2-reductase n=1 Tax=Aspergillus campestris (strain IBT 28561) TaxID=1392248 RepID=A0A2I1CSW8_ASPC2|nr:2-dehydropantoate 2-reductase [Aspergillus campestris IBT 28561]PKY00726.1 2-dehydropantoate 2-reductase [Aspergillus campestris IBT 28561]
MAKSRVLLIGCGGIGTVAALNLQTGQQADVSVVLRSNYAAVQAAGFRIDSCDHGVLENWRPAAVLNSVPDTSADPATRFDYIVCCTKNIADSTPQLSDIMGPAVTPGHTVIVLIQNGLNIERPVQARFPSNIVLSGVSRTDAHEIAKGVIQHKQSDNLNIGAFNHPTIDPTELTAAAEHFVRIYSAGGKTVCRHEPNVGLDRWTKLVYNATLNPICALTGLDTGSLQTDGRSLDALVVPAMKEVVAVAAAKGYLLPEHIIPRTIASNPVDKKISPSMLVDVRKGNLIEHENILGEVVREAEALGIAAPMLSMLYHLCCGVQLRLKKGN